MKLFYEPNNAYFGDCMPFYHDDTFYVFTREMREIHVLLNLLNGLWQRQRILSIMKIKE